ncbi:MAG: hypothetical protein AAF720_07635 [Pseudomonadota bacterium]
MEEKSLESRLDDRLAGYVASFFAFGAITALWAFVVRGDDFYGTMPVFGAVLPVTTITYLLTMPVFGFIAGKWRYEAPTSPFWLGKAFARSLNFIYSHLLIVLFTAAMVTQSFLGWNIDDAVREIDDRLFDIASRFAPWLAAYLAGFNLGRATGLRTAREREAEAITNANKRQKKKKRAFFDDKNKTNEPSISTDNGIAADAFESRFAENSSGRGFDGSHSLAGANSNERFAFKRDPVLFDDDGNKRPTPKRKRQRRSVRDPSKPAALFRSKRHNGELSDEDLEYSSTMPFEQATQPATSFDRLR